MPPSCEASERTLVIVLQGIPAVAVQGISISETYRANEIVHLDFVQGALVIGRH